jgi:hypothetical protein
MGRAKPILVVSGFRADRKTLELDYAAVSAGPCRKVKARIVVKPARQSRD